MSAPWGGDPQPGPPSWGGSGDEGPVDPYAGQAAPLPAPAYPAWGGPPGPNGWPAATIAAPRQGAPGPLLAGSIVQYVFAAMLFVSGLFLLFSGSVLADAVDALEPSVGDGSTSLVVAGLGNWLAVALLVTSGVMVSMRRSVGLVLTAIANGLIVLLAVSWVALFPDGGIVFWAFVHVLFALVGAGLILVPPGNRAWLGSLSGSRPAAA